MRTGANQIAASRDWLQPQTLADAHGLPATCYTDAELAVRERSAVFARSWQLVAHRAQLATPGDHVVAEVAGTPLLLLRDDAELRALHNVCRHRGGPLAIANGKGLKHLRCHYHGWTYDLAGCLKSGPELDAIAGLDRASTRLPVAQVAEWQGLVFVALDPATPPFAELVAGIDARLAGHGMAGYIHQRHVSYTAACNWKAYVDNYAEGYHVPHVHPALNQLLDYRSYRTECARWYSLQSSPLDDDASFYGSGEGLYYLLWPNTMLNILPGRLQTNRVVALGVDRCRIDFDYFYAPGIAERDAERIAQDQDLAEVTQQEDIQICERVHKAFSSGSYTIGRVHPTREQGIHHFQELYRAAMRAAAAELL